MFEVSIVILSRLLWVLAGFFIYRKLYKWQGFEETIIGRNGTATLTELRSQQGFISLASSARRKTKTVKLTNGSLEFKTPWGW